MNSIRKTAMAIALCPMLLCSRATYGDGLPPVGVLPEEETAVRVAEVILSRHYGTAEFEKFKPYHATLEAGVWTVSGHLQEGHRGGTPMLRIRKDDARVLEIWHSM